MPINHSTQPDLYSLWMYVDHEAGNQITFIEVTGTSTYGVPAGSIELKYYSLNGTSNNRHHVQRDIPEELQSPNFDQFWTMVDERRLMRLDPLPGQAEGRTMLQLGGRI